MNFVKLNTIKKDYFGYNEIARVLDIKPDSARVTANRYVKNNILLRVKRDMYILRERWKYFTREQKFEIANLLQVPSYISLISALDYYEITTQMQRDFIESIVIKRTKEIKIMGTIFNYTKIDKKLYTGFKREKSIFMASPEMAFLDAVYLKSLGRYNFDVTAIDFDKLNRKLLSTEIKNYPDRTYKYLERNGYFPSS